MLLDSLLWNKSTGQAPVIQAVRCAAPAVVASPLEQLVDDLNEMSRRSPKSLIKCASCQNPITNHVDRIEIHNAHFHRCENPSGFIFDIACFAEALGCMIAGELAMTFTWFAGYRWQFAHCEQCGEHLGWYYQASVSDYFFGLIVNKLLNEA